MTNLRSGQNTTKEEHLNWFVTKGADSIGDFKLLHVADGVMVGTHTANFGEEVSLVMNYGKEESSKLIEWTINAGSVETA